MFLDPTPNTIPADLLFETNPAPMFVIDKETYSFVEVNRAAVAHYRYSRQEFLNKTIFDIRPVEEIPQLLDQIRAGKMHSGGRIWRHLKRDGELMHVRPVWQDVNFGARPAILVTVHDVSDQVRLQEQFRQSQKMEAVGRLAAGVAHDFNNLLTVISGNAAMLAEDIQDASHLAKVLDIQKAAARASNLTRSLLAFSRKSASQQTAVNPNAIVKGICEMVERMIGEDIQVRTVLHPGVRPIRANPVELEQVLMNLAVNARDAMPSGGILTIQTAVADLTDAEAADLHAANGRYTLLCVSDTGCGMDEATKRRIFEPFFTTKPQGQGTGLGLSTVYAIVMESGGRIAVQSAPGRGSEFRIYWPVVEEFEDNRPGRQTRAAPGSETILVVEDEPVVREVASQGLKRRGYNVISAPNEESAVETCSRTGGPVHLLLTDVVMPQTNGLQLAERLKGIQPQLQVLFMSGYTEEALAACGLRRDSVNLIHKPFTFDELHRKVREILDAAL